MIHKFLIVAAVLISSLHAGETDAAKAALLKLNTEFAERNETIRKKYAANLKMEERAAQNAGKLDLLRAIKARLMEIEDKDNPFHSGATFGGTPVEGSLAEKQYASDIAASSQLYELKIEALIRPIDAKKVSATKAGKLDDAEMYDKLISDIYEEKLPTPYSPQFYAGTWIKLDTKNELTLNADLTITSAVPEVAFRKGSWKFKINEITLEFPNKPMTQILTIKDADTLSNSSWTLKRKK